MYAGQTLQGEFPYSVVMIICHPLKIIFIKTKKVAGTSFELALSKYCSDECIITPLQPQDEALRVQRGFCGAQNYTLEGRVGRAHPASNNFNLVGDFFNHNRAAFIRKRVGPRRWREYSKISIHRDPLDFLLSQYFYQCHAGRVVASFGEWFQQNKENVLVNRKIAPLTGELACDIVFDYERLSEQIRDCTLLPGDFLSVFESFTAKSGARPEASRDVLGFYRAHNICVDEVYDILSAADQPLASV